MIGGFGLLFLALGGSCVLLGGFGLICCLFTYLGFGCSFVGFDFALLSLRHW